MAYELYHIIFYTTGINVNEKAYPIEIGWF